MPGAILLAGSPNDPRSLRRTHAQGLPAPHEFTAKWRYRLRSYRNSDNAIRFTTPFTIGPSGTSAFTGTSDYVVAFTTEVFDPPRWAVGNAGDDRIAPAEDFVELNRFYTQALQRWEDRPGVWINRFWYDLPRPVFVEIEGPVFVPYRANHVLMFGNGPWTSTPGIECVDGYVTDAAFWTVRLPDEILFEVAQHLYPEPTFRRGLWARWPLQSVSNLGDVSGNNRPLFNLGTITDGDGPSQVLVPQTYSATEHTLPVPAKSAADDRVVFSMVLQSWPFVATDVNAIRMITRWIDSAGQPRGSITTCGGDLAVSRLDGVRRIEHNVEMLSLRNATNLEVLLQPAQPIQSVAAVVRTARSPRIAAAVAALRAQGATVNDGDRS